MLDDEDEMGDFIVDEGGARERARRRRAALAGGLQGVSAAALEVRQAMGRMSGLCLGMQQ
jgi:hypothetical protein